MVILYSTGCPKCKVLKAKLDAAGIAYETCSDTDKMLSMGIMSVPVLDTGDGEFKQFSDAVKWVNDKIDSITVSTSSGV